MNPQPPRTLSTSSGDNLPLPHNPGGTMRRTILLTAACLLAVVGCSSGPSYEETVKECKAALVAQYKADGNGKPSECDGVKKDDYDALVLDAALGDLDWTDRSGDFDKGKMLDSVTKTP